MRKLLLLTSALFLFYACKGTPTDTGSSGGCGTGANPDSLNRFTITGSPFGPLDWNSVYQSMSGLTVRVTKDGRTIHTIVAGFSPIKGDMGVSLTVSIPTWQTGSYSWESLSSSREGVGAALVYSFYDVKSARYVSHSFYSTSGGTTINITGKFGIRDSTTALGTFCGTLKDSLGNVITLEDGLVHYDRKI